MATKTKDVRIIVKGLPEGIPDDRIAYLVNSVVGRASSVAVEAVGVGKPHPTGEDRARARLASVKSKILGGGGDAEPA